MLFKKRKQKQRPKVGLCLSGGGARGFAHVGALKAFEQEGIEFDLTVGVSAGSIVGAMYCAGKSADEIMVYGERLNMKDIHSGLPIPPCSTDGIKKLVTDFIGDINIEDMPRKFACVSVDLVQARQIVADSGKVGVACAASSCVPLLFRPVVIGDKHLVDGGLLNNIPADVCRMLGAEKVVTVDVNPTRGSGRKGLSYFGVLKATLSIMTANASVIGLKNSDIVIAPDMSEFSSSSKEGWEKMIQHGYEKAMLHIQEIKELFG